MDYLSPFLISLLGLLLMIIAFLYKHPTIEKWDSNTFIYINQHLNKLVGICKFIWPLGTTPVTILLVSMSFLEGRFVGTTVALAYIGIAAIEKIIKNIQSRLRPFTTVNDIKISQPTKPNDYSFPSGDTMRIWYLAFTIPIIFNLGWPVIICTCFVAACISLGRIILGVHYPLDLIGGFGLSLLGVSYVISRLQLSFTP